MTRDTFDMFEKPERGRFGDNESRSSSQRVTGASDLKDFVLLLRAETAKAIGVSEEDGADAKVTWLPKSQIEFREEGKGLRLRHRSRMAGEREGADVMVQLAQYAPPKPDRPEIILDAIYDEVHFELNPNDDECWHCGGEGETHDYIDGCCEDAESGCDLCSRPCVECRIHAGNVKRAVRIEVLRAMDVDLARAFLKRERNWKPSMTPKVILINLHAGRVACDAFTADERADSACWVEGLL